MPIAERELIFEAIRRTLATCKDSDSHASLVAQTTINTLNKISSQLEPMIGLRGIEVLFSRCLYLSSNEFFWLTPTGNQSETATLMAFISERLEVRESDEAIKASYTILATFTELLISLVGASLTSRLLDPIWVPVPPTLQQDSPS